MQLEPNQRSRMRAPRSERDPHREELGKLLGILGVRRSLAVLTRAAAPLLGLMSGIRGALCCSG